MHVAAFATHFAQIPQLGGAPQSGGVLDAANPTVFLGLLIGAVLVIATLVDKVDAFLQRRKRTPSIEREFVTKEEFRASTNEAKARLQNIESEFVTKQELREWSGRVESELRISRIAVEKLSNNINREFNSLYRALGKVEGVTLEDRNG